MKTSPMTSARETDDRDADLDAVRSQPTYTNHLRALERLRASGRLNSGAGRRVAILSTFTIEPVANCLHVCAHLDQAPIDIKVCPPQEIARTVLDDAGELYQFDPDVIVVMALSEAVVGQFATVPGQDAVHAQETLQQSIAQFVELIAALRRRSRATLLISNFVAREASSLGLLDWHEPLGMQRAIEAFNHGLADWARTQDRIFVFDLAGLCASAGRDFAFDQRMYLLAQQPFATAFVPRLAAELQRYVLATARPPRKCLVLDLDNTLWGGVLAEEGMAGLRLGHDPVGTAFLDFQRAVLSLSKRGVLLAICSRNDEDEARAALSEHPEIILRPQHFAALRVGWTDKAASIVSIAEELNIGLDSFVFLDDDEFERQNIRERVPEVLVPDLPADPVQYRKFLLGLTAFDTLQLTSEDRVRGQMYAERSQREALKATAHSLDAYLVDLQMEITVAPPDGATKVRLFQLAHKTNRFNLTTYRYTDAEFEARVAGPGSEVFGIRVRDRLGDNGVVGLVVLIQAGDVCEIETFLLSCRVLGRSIETAILAYAAERARALGSARLRGRYVPSAKNALVADLYQRHGFTSAGHDGTTELWEASMRDLVIAAPAWARVGATR